MKLRGHKMQERDNREQAKIVFSERKFFSATFIKQWKYFLLLKIQEEKVIGNWRHNK